MAKASLAEQASPCTISEGSLTLNKCFLPYFFLLSVTPRIVSRIKELDIPSRRKLFGAEFQKTHTQMTSFLALSHVVILGQYVAINIPFKF